MKPQANRAETFSEVMFWPSGLSHNDHSSVWVLMTCLNHTHTPPHIIMLPGGNQFMKIHLSPAEIIPSNRPAGLYSTCAGRCDVDVEMKNSPSWTPGSMLTVRFWPLGPFRPASDKSLWFCLCLPCSTGEQRRRSGESNNQPPTLPPSISSFAFQCKHVRVLLLVFPLKNASLCR